LRDRRAAALHPRRDRRLATALGTSDGEPTIVQRALTPRNVGIHITVSRQLLLQAPGAEALFAQELLRVIGAATDTAVLVGTGAPQPAGIAATSGIGTADLSTASVTKVAGLRKAIENGRGRVTAAFARPDTTAVLRAREVSTGGGRYLVEGSVLDHDIPLFSTPTMSSGKLLLGDFPRCVVAQWGPLAVESNPYHAFAAGQVGMRVITSLDVGVLDPAAFALGTGVS
jgi:HK97 family phage major capsid protein